MRSFVSRWPRRFDKGGRTRSSLFGLPTLCDEWLGENEIINFNAGDHGISVSMQYADYVQVEQPELGMFAEPATPEAPR